MFLSVTLFFIGLFLLVKGADVLVDGASLIAKKFGVTSIVIGLTIVSFGTSAPELIVSTLAAWRGNADISLGNVIGSNIANILLILGASALIAPLVVKRNTVNKEIPLSILSVAVLIILANDSFFSADSVNRISRADGLVLLLFFVIFLYYAFSILKEKDGGLIVRATEFFKKENEKYKYTFPIACLMVVSGLVGLAIGGKLVVDGAVEFARIFGLSEALISLTIIAIGTSLPELATSAVAARKGEVDIAIGNVVGSNIFNILWILGVSSVIRPLSFQSALNIDMLILFSVNLLLLFLIYIGKRNVLWRWEGATLLAMYAGYVAFLIYRG